MVQRKKYSKWFERNIFFLKIDLTFIFLKLIVQPLDWYQSEVHNSSNVSIDSVPNQHWSFRGNMFKKSMARNSTQWCGFIIKSAQKSIYFSGDTGYDGELFKGD